MSTSAAAPLQVFGMSAATCTQRIVQAAKENNASYVINKVDLMKGEQKQPAHLARQPFGVIPALEGEGFSEPLYESRAITRYVDFTRGGKLTPSTPQKRALMEQWCSLEQGTFDFLSTIVYQRVFVPFRGQKPDETKIAEAVEKSKLPLDVMEKHLAKNQWLAGDEFSLAEVMFMPYLHLLMKHTPEKSLFESRPNVAAWWKRAFERPSWQATIAEGSF